MILKNLEEAIEAWEAKGHKEIPIVALKEYLEVIKKSLEEYCD